MALEYFDWEVGDVIVLHLQGPITLGEGTRKLRALIQEKLATDKDQNTFALRRLHDDLRHDSTSRKRPSADFLQTTP